MVRITPALCAAALLALTGNAAMAGGFAEPTIEPSVVSSTPAQSFDGFYLGGAISSVKSDFDKNCSEDSYACGSEADIYTGGTSTAYGIRIGHDWRRGDWALGVLADVDSISGGKSQLDLMASLRLRLGKVLAERSMVYASAGLAHAKLSGVQDASYDTQKSSSGSGFVLGLGFERYVSDRISLYGEFNHYDFSDIGRFENFGDPSDRFKVSAKVQALKLGLNYRF